MKNYVCKLRRKNWKALKKYNKLHAIRIALIYYSKYDVLDIVRLSEDHVSQDSGLKIGSPLSLFLQNAQLWEGEREPLVSSYSAAYSYSVLSLIYLPPVV